MNLAKAIDGAAQEVFGRRDLDGAALERAVQRLSQTYTRERQTLERTGETEALVARLRFFLPRDAPKLALPLDELHGANAMDLNRPLRVLDLGAGVGASSLGVAAWLAAKGFDQRVEIDAVDRSAAALTVLRALGKRLRPPDAAEIAFTTTVADVSTGGWTPPAPHAYDLVVVSFVLNELWQDRDPRHRAERQRALLGRLSACLAANGSLLILEPALRETARALHELRDGLLAEPMGLSVFAPCLHHGPCPMLEHAKDWCHEDRDYQLSPALAGIARGAGLRTSRLTFTYLTLRRDDRTLAKAIGSAADRRAHVGTDRVEDGLLLRAVSQPIRTKGKLEIFGCGGGRRLRLVRLDRHRTDANRALDHCHRGDLFTVGSDASDADASPAAAPGSGARDRRLPIVAETHVDRIGAPRPVQR